MFILKETWKHSIVLCGNAYIHVRTYHHRCRCRRRIELVFRYQFKNINTN